MVHAVLAALIGIDTKLLIRKPYYEHSFFCKHCYSPLVVFGLVKCLADNLSARLLSFPMGQIIDLQSSARALPPRPLYPLEMEHSGQRSDID
jgi:hypothetical protein